MRCGCCRRYNRISGVRGFNTLPSAKQAMDYIGLVPSEHSGVASGVGVALPGVVTPTPGMCWSKQLGTTAKRPESEVMRNPLANIRLIHRCICSLARYPLHHA